jgi:hypothetical protein
MNENIAYQLRIEQFYLNFYVAYLSACRDGVDVELTDQIDVELHANTLPESKQNLHARTICKHAAPSCNAQYSRNLARTQQPCTIQARNLPCQPNKRPVSKVASRYIEAVNEIGRECPHIAPPTYTQLQTHTIRTRTPPPIGTRTPAKLYMHAHQTRNLGAKPGASEERLRHINANANSNKKINQAAPH